MRTRWAIGPRGLIGLIVGVVAATLLAPVAVSAVDSSPVYITDETGATPVAVSDFGDLFVTARAKDPLPVQGTVDAESVPNQPQLLREVDVPGSAIVAVFPTVFHNEEQVALSDATFANLSGANVNVSVFGYGIGSATSCGGALPSPLGPSLITVSVPAHDSVVVALSEPAIAPRRAFTGNWCVGASQFSSPGTADVLVTLQGYRL